MSRVLIKGNEAIGEAAIRAGCRFFFGYPITPQSELPEYLSRELPKVGGVYLQAESEIGAIYMVYGAAATGARVMTSSSSPGISLKQEGISYIAAAELPCVIVNIMRGGPGLGSIQPSQSDYFQATRGGGHGGYRTIVLAPASVQEAVDLVALSFDLSEKHRIPVMLLGDGVLGQMMEAVEFKENNRAVGYFKPWIVGSKKEYKKKNCINTLYLESEKLEDHNMALQRKYEAIKVTETRAEVHQVKDADLVIAAYGITARVAKAAAELARADGLKVGVFRPITLWPFPEKELNKATKGARGVLTVEMSMGQMVEDVRLSINGRIPVEFYGRLGSTVPSEREIYSQIKRLAEELGVKAQ